MKFGTGGNVKRKNFETVRLRSTTLSGVGHLPLHENCKRQQITHIPPNPANEIVRYCIFEQLTPMTKRSSHQSNLYHLFSIENARTASTKRADIGGKCASTWVPFTNHLDRGIARRAKHGHISFKYRCRVVTRRLHNFANILAPTKLLGPMHFDNHCVLRTFTKLYRKSTSYV